MSEPKNRVIFDHPKYFTSFSKKIGRTIGRAFQRPKAVGMYGKSVTHIFAQQTPAVNKKDISHSMAASNFPGLSRIAVAQEAMQHLEKNSATFQNIFARFKIPESEYQLLAGFDEDFIRSRLGYLDQIHIILRSEPQDMNDLLLSLSSAIKNFTAIIYTNKSTYRLPSAPEEFRAIVRANTHNTSYGISSLSQNADTGGSFSIIGGNNGGDGPESNRSTRKGKDRERDSEDPSMPHDSGKEDGEPGPESPGPGNRDVQSAELTFQVSANLLQNDVPFQTLEAQGAFKINRTRESADLPQFATCNIEFTGLCTSNLHLSKASEEIPMYHHFQIDIRFDAQHVFSYTPNIRPRSTLEHKPEAKVSKGVKKALSAVASGSLTLLPLKATIGASASRTGEDSTNTEKTVNISRTIHRQGRGVIEWTFHLVDQFERASGLTFSAENLPLAHFVFGGDQAAPPSPPAHVNMEIFTYWSTLSSPRASTGWTGSKPRFSNLCQMIVFNLPKDLQGSYLYLSDLLVEADANPILTTVQSEAQGYLGRATVVETKQTPQ